MQRIIQKYQEGGTVQPVTATGLPAGGNAASAIANYMMGPMSANATTLSYTGGGEGIPDYHALALEQQKLREAAALVELQSQIANAGSTSSGQDKMEERKEKGGDLYVSPSTTFTDDYGVTRGQNYNNKESFASGGGADGKGNFGKVGDFFGGLKDKVFGSNMGGPIGYNMGSIKKPVGYNMGNLNGPIGYNVGGVSQVARTMLPEEQIRQRQMQQAQFDGSRGPLGEIQDKLLLGAANKGVSAGMKKLASSAALSAIPGIGPFLALFA